MDATPKNNSSLALIGIGIVGGVIIAWFLFTVLGARPNEVTVGPVKFGIPTATTIAPQPASQQSAPVQQSGQQQSAASQPYWKPDDKTQTITWTGPTDGSEDIWQGDEVSLKKIREGYVAIFTTNVPGEFVKTCILTVNGNPIKNSCESYNTPYPIPAGTWQVTSKSPPDYPTNGGFRWTPADGYGWRK